MTNHASWTSFGASVIGPAHIATGKCNQDAWASFHHMWGDGIAVSDGVGSKALSDFGSRASCRAVETAVRRLTVARAAGLEPSLLDDIRDEWLRGIAPIDPREASATCLFAFRLGDGIVRIGLLGDGCAAAVDRHGTVKSLSEDKTGGFSNMTKALSPATTKDQWTLLDVPESECEAVVLCTDGVSDDLEDLAGFVAGFVNANRGIARLIASARTRHMLDMWPVPSHSDDKTLACLRRQEFAGE